MIKLLRLSTTTSTFSRCSHERQFTNTVESIRRRAAANALRLNLPPAPGCRTKIICTLGPASDTEQQVKFLVDHGMHVARLNFSHAGNDYTYADSNLDLVRSAMGRHASLATTDRTALPPNLRAVLVDTKGPEVRTGALPGDVDVLDIAMGVTVELHTNEANVFPDEDVVKLLVDYQSISKTVSPGGQVLLDDGLIALEVVECQAEYVTCVALNGGPIKKNKGVNLPGCTLDLPALTDKDKRDLKWSVNVGADYVAASFIRTPEHVRSVIAFLERCVADLPQPSGQLRPLVVSKIESKEGVDNFDDILRESDGIMVARGDLGVEIPYSTVFAEQKRMVKACNLAGKPVIVATQMLDSMQRNPRPTRAEVTDVGTAVLDGADAVMLSGETAAGKYPIESLKAMTSVVWEADQIVTKSHDMVWNQDLHDGLSVQDQELDATAASAVKAAKNMNAKMILLITMSGRVARAIARHRPHCPVLAFCTDAQVGRRLQLHRSIYPIMLQSTLDPGLATTRMGLLRAEAVRTAKELGFARSGDRIIMVDRTKGKEHDMHDYGHNMKVVTLKDL